MTHAALDTTGAERTTAAFCAATDAGRAALVTYLMCGDPSPARTPDLVAALVEGGTDVVELGMPSSDPLADGPVIEAAGHRALDAGTTLDTCFEVVTEVRSRGISTPIILMGYANPLLAYGVDRGFETAARAGVDGFIIADLPMEEAEEEFAPAAAEQGLALVQLATPVTGDDRLGRLVAASSGFCYCVSRTGITGARDELPPDVAAFITRARQLAAPLPVAVGFGVSSPEHVRALAPHADGIVVGSALVRLVEEAPDDHAVELLRRAVSELAAACAR